MRRLLTVLVVSLSVALLSAQARTTLDIYLVDVEGGNATLFVAPSGESLLIDTGNGGAAAMRDARPHHGRGQGCRLTQIDHLITTHYHGDHFGAMAEVASRIPIKEFIDHGPNVQPAAADRRVPAEGVSAALRQEQAHRREAGRQDRAQRSRCARRGVGGADDCQPAARRRQARIRTAPPTSRKDPDPSENAQSVGTHFTFGRFKTVHMGDLTWNKESD